MTIAPPPLSPDLAVGAFTDHGPWVVDPDRLTWRKGITVLRARTKAEVPGLMRRRTLPPGRRVIKVGVVLGNALGRWYVGARRKGQETSRADLSKRLRDAFEQLGPTYIKLGQIISSGEGIFPEELVLQFRELRDKVRAETFDTVREVIETDLGRPLEDVFSWFAPEPVAAASIAQVHRATLRSGEQVVVKVQRPTVSRLVREDLAAMSWIAPVLVGRIPVAALANPPALVELFAETIVEELDFRLEAENMMDTARILAETGESHAMVVPRPHPDLVTRRVLVMEELAGFAFDDVVGMHAAGIDTQRIVTAGMVAFLEGAMLYGIFHGDLHGGNLLVMADGRVGLLDHGITGRLDEPRRLAFLRLLMGGTVNDINMQLGALRDLGALPADVDIQAVIRDLKLDGPPVDPTTLSADQMVAEIRELTKALLSYGARMPKELMLFVKDMLFLDGAIATMAPDVDLFAEITTVATHMATRHGERILNDIGIDPRTVEVNLDGLKASVGVNPDTPSMTYRELQERRQVIAKRMEGRRKKR
ncbi:MAG: AarF/UbiB family protein [Acidimicrobiales bacterium]